MSKTCFRHKIDTKKLIKLPKIRDAKFPGILRAISFHREYWEFCGNLGEYLETLGILK